MTYSSRVALASFVLFAALSTSAAGAEIGAIVMHGKWGSPERVVDALAIALEREGFAVNVPEMPWSGRRLYDRPVEAALVETDAEIGRMQKEGAKHIFVVGQSLGAAYALHYATRSAVTGVVAIAPGHRAESPGFARLFASELVKARGLAASGKGDEQLWFNDPNTGGRRKPIRASATVFLSYFDQAGPLNMTRNASAVKPEVPVLWLVPTREEQPNRDVMVGLYKTLPSNPGTRFAEPEADHLNAPSASTRIVIEWIRAIVAQAAGRTAADKK